MWKALSKGQRGRFVGVLLFALCYGIVLGHSFFLPRLVHALGGTTANAASLTALSLVPILLMATVGKTWIAAWSSVRVLRTGLAISTLAFSAYTFAPSVAAMAPIALLQGLGYALTFTRLLVGATALVPRAYYGAGVAYVTVALQIGNGAGSFIASVLEPQLGSHHIFWMPAAIALLAQLLVRAFQSDTRPSVAAVDKGKAGVAVVEVGRILVLFAVLGLSFGVPLQFVPLWLATIRLPSLLANASPAYFITTSFMAIVLSRLLFGHLLQGARQHHVVAVCMLILTASLFCLSKVASPAGMVAVALFYGMSYSLLYPSGVAYVLQRGTDYDRVQRSAWLMLGFEFGTKLFPLSLAFLADHRGFPDVFLALSFIVCVFGLWHVWDRMTSGRLQSASI